MKKIINLKESLLSMDKDTDCRYDLTNLYEACNLDDKKKRDLAKYVTAYDIEGTNKFLSNEASSMGLMENATDDLSDEEFEAQVTEGFIHMTDENTCNPLVTGSSLKEGDLVYDEETGNKLKVVSIEPNSNWSRNIQFIDTTTNETFTNIVGNNSLWETAVDGDATYEVDDDIDFEFHPIDELTSQLNSLDDEEPIDEGIISNVIGGALKGAGQGLLGEDLDTSSIEQEVKDAMYSILEPIYDTDFVNDYCSVSVEDTEDNVVVHVSAELGFNALSNLGNQLNKIVTKYDPKTYFETETSGRLVCYIRKDQSDDIVDEEAVEEWTTKFNACKTRDELISVYKELVDLCDNGGVTYGTIEVLFDVIDAKSDELQKLGESLTDDFSSITALADDCGKNTFKTSNRDIRFTFNDETSASKFMDELRDKNIHFDELPKGVIKVNKSAAFDESLNNKEIKFQVTADLTGMDDVYSEHTNLKDAIESAKVAQQSFMNVKIKDLRDNSSWQDIANAEADLNDGLVEESLNEDNEPEDTIIDDNLINNIKDVLRTYQYSVPIYDAFGRGKGYKSIPLIYTNKGVTSTTIKACYPSKNYNDTDIKNISTALDKLTNNAQNITVDINNDGWIQGLHCDGYIIRVMISNGKEVNHKKGPLSDVDKIKRQIKKWENKIRGIHGDIDNAINGWDGYKNTYCEKILQPQLQKLVTNNNIEVRLRKKELYISAYTKDISYEDMRKELDRLLKLPQFAKYTNHKSTYQQSKISPDDIHYMKFNFRVYFDENLIEYPQDEIDNIKNEYIDELTQAEQKLAEWKNKLKELPESLTEDSDQLDINFADEQPEKYIKLDLHEPEYDHFTIGGKEVPYKSHEEAKAHLDDFNLKDYEEELYKYLKSKNMYPEMYVDNNNTLCVSIEWGDWKHDHMYIDSLINNFFFNRGLILDRDTVVTEDDGSDVYSATHYYTVQDVIFSMSMKNNNTLDESVEHNRRYVITEGVFDDIKNVAKSVGRTIKNTDLYKKDIAPVVKDIKNSVNTAIDNSETASKIKNAYTTVKNSDIAKTVKETDTYKNAKAAYEQGKQIRQDAKQIKQDTQQGTQNNQQNTQSSAKTANTGAKQNVRVAVNSNKIMKKIRSAKSAEELDNLVSTIQQYQKDGRLDKNPRANNIYKNAINKRKKALSNDGEILNMDESLNEDFYDDDFTDEEMAGLLGGELMYCPDCGSGRYYDGHCYACGDPEDINESTDNDEAYIYEGGRVPKNIRDKIKQVVVKDGVKHINNDAFYNCTSLISIEIPDSVTSIGNHSFAGCSSLETIVLPNSIESIGDTAFAHCENLSSVIMGSRVKGISVNTFSNCKNLISVTIPNGVEYIDGHAFYNCSSLVLIEIPYSVTSISNDAFDGCNNIVVRCNKGSYAESYAQERDIPIEYIDRVDESIKNTIWNKQYNSELDRMEYDYGDEDKLHCYIFSEDDDGDWGYTVYIKNGSKTLYHTYFSATKIDTVKEWAENELQKYTKSSGDDEYLQEDVEKLPDGWQKDERTLNRYVYNDDQLYASATISNSIAEPNNIDTYIMILSKTDADKCKEIKDTVIVDNVSDSWNKVLSDTVIKADNIIKQDINNNLNEGWVTSLSDATKDLSPMDKDGFYKVMDNITCDPSNCPLDQLENEVSEIAARYTDGNASSEYEGEDFYNDEYSGSKIYNAILKLYGRDNELNESKSINEVLSDYRFEVSCNDGPSKVITTVATNEESAINYVKKYYAQEHTTYADDRANKWVIRNLD